MGDDGSIVEHLGQFQRSVTRHPSIFHSVDVQRRNVSDCLRLHDSLVAFSARGKARDQYGKLKGDITEWLQSGEDTAESSTLLER